MNFRETECKRAGCEGLGKEGIGPEGAKGTEFQFCEMKMSSVDSDGCNG